MSDLLKCPKFSFECARVSRMTFSKHICGKLCHMFTKYIVLNVWNSSVLWCRQHLHEKPLLSNVLENCPLNAIGLVFCCGWGWDKKVIVLTYHVHFSKYVYIIVLIDHLYLTLLLISDILIVYFKKKCFLYHMQW